MTEFRLSRAAGNDIVEILAWSQSHFGEQARRRYEVLLVAALREAASDRAGTRSTVRPDLGAGVHVWHLRQSVDQSAGGRVRRPRHLLVYRLEDGRMVVGRILHETMDIPRHVESGDVWT